MKHILRLFIGVFATSTLPQICRAERIGELLSVLFHDDGISRLDCFSAVTLNSNLMEAPITFESVNGCVYGCGDSMSISSSGRTDGPDYISFYGRSSDTTLNLVKDRLNERFTASTLNETSGIVTKYGVDAEGVTYVVEMQSGEYMEELDPVRLDGPEEPVRKDRERRNLDTDRDPQSPYCIDILVVWTKRAECYDATRGKNSTCTLTPTTANNIQAKVNLAVFETNVAFKNSNIGAQFRLVHSYRHPDYIETSDNIFGNALYSISGITDDDVMDDVHAKRIEYGADLVSLFVDGAREACGIGYFNPNKLNATRMFSAVHVLCATGVYTLGHEIGHNLVGRRFSSSAHLLMI